MKFMIIVVVALVTNLITLPLLNLFWTDPKEAVSMPPFRADAPSRSGAVTFR